RAPRPASPAPRSPSRPAEGFVGAALRGTTGRVDAFGARTLGGAVITPPSAPQNLQATPGNGSVALAWGAPSSLGGAASVTYTLYHPPSPRPNSLLPAS